MASATRQRVLSFTSPDLRDLFFWERDTLSRVDYTDLVNDATRRYGTAHPDTVKFPDHKLVYWESDPDFQGGNDGQDSLRVRKYYVADRANQDDYNFEFSQADLGGNQYDTVVRTYVILRADFDDTDSSLEAGDAMPDAAGLFTDDYILMTRQQKRIGEKELDSLFVIEQRVYFKDEDKISFTAHREFKDELSTTETLAHVGKTGIVTNAGTVTWSTAAAIAVANWGVATDGSYEYSVQKLSNDWWKVVKQQLVGQNRLTAPTGNLLARRPYAMAKEERHTHVTPVVGDVLFYVTVDRPSDGGDGTPDHPAYGSTYGIAPFSSHKLCFVEQADPEGQYFKYYYAADRADQDDYNFEVTAKELAGQKFNAVKRTYITLRADWDEDAPAMGSAMPRDPDTRFPTGYVLVGRDQKRIGQKELDALYVVEVRTYAAFFDVDQEDYNYEFTAADIGGQKFNAVKRTYITLRSDWSESSPAMGSAMSREPDDKFPTGYVLAQRQQRPIGQKELDTLYVVEVMTYVEKVNIVSQKLDPASGGVLTTEQELFYRGEPGAMTGSSTIVETVAATAGNWGLNSTGVNEEIEQLSDNWWLVTRQDVIPQGGSPDSDLGYLLRTYETWEDFSWPAVVNGNSFDFRLIQRKNGSSSATVRIVPFRKAYSGPTKFQIKQWWKKTAATLSSPVIFDVQSATYSGAQYSCSVRNVLIGAGGVSLIDNIGTQDPVFTQGVYGANPWLLASSMTDWPDTSSSPALVATKQQPFRGGFLTTETRVYRPY